MGANPNTFAFKQVWDNLYEITHYKQPVYRAIASERIEPMLTKGDTFYREYTSDFYVENLGADGAYTTQGLTDTQESLVVNTEKDVSFYVAKPDLVKQHLPTVIKYGRKAMNRLFLQIDADVLGNAYFNAGTIVDDGSLGGTSGNGLTPSVGNIQNLFTYAQMVLQLNNVEYGPNEQYSGDVKLDTTRSMAVSIITPQVYQVLLQYLGGKTTLLGDATTKNGFATLFMGFNIFVSNQTGWSSSLALPTLPTDGDTMTINGITFTFKTVLGSTAGNIIIADTAAHQAQLVASVLNAPFTNAASGTWANTSSNYVVLAGTTAQRKALSNVTAVEGLTADSYTTDTTGTFVNFRMYGFGTIVVSSTFTAAGNTFTSARQKQHCIFGVNNSIAVVIQQRPEFLENPVSGKVGRDYVTWTMYGIKVFTDQAPMLIDVQINSSTYTAPSNNFQ